MLRLKVCGMKSTADIQQLITLPIDYLGYIFYEKSPRYISDVPAVIVPKSIQKVGVFVNASLSTITQKVAQFGLQLIQLHGEETAASCASVKKNIPTVKIIKAFGIGETFDWQILSEYEGVVDFFLLDTKGEKRGGNGVKFNWELLKKYSSPTPFWLSGGIDLEDIDTIKKIKNPMLYAIDVNSKFEYQAGVKDIKKLKQLTNELQD